MELCNIPIVQMSLEINLFFSFFFISAPKCQSDETATNFAWDLHPYGFQKHYNKAFSSDTLQ